MLPKNYKDKIEGMVKKWQEKCPEHDYNQLVQPLVQAIEKQAFMEGGIPWAEQCAKFHDLKTIVEKQAEDEGLWFISETVPEAYLQLELRKLHAAIETKIASHEKWLEESDG